ncbi:TadE/TadG family type IV pilus assembly protein [Aromatoleum toluclasticum]|uniref:TadE/TadG family type IV pilus assembly protein n=1 Tax=Aromatoleum toluclasticum TaxID=92003 RepID=UPI00058D877A|nr:TadE family protein [Aromatoleum toluclasticum]
MKKTIYRLQIARRENGTTAVEFAIVAMVFLLIVLGIMEFGRLLYVWNTVQEVTRRAAREAVVRTADDASLIARMAVFHNETSSGTVRLPAGLEISNAEVKLNYLRADLSAPSPMPVDASGHFDPAKNLAACNSADPNELASCVRFVEACLATDGACANTVKYAPMINLFPFLAIDIPVSRVLMPAESLGFNISE